MANHSNWFKVEYDADLERFIEINERPVKRISMEVFYKPRTITLLFACVAGLTATAFVRFNPFNFSTFYFNHFAYGCTGERKRGW